MSGFQIPGLGFAKPNEVLPPVPSQPASETPAPSAERQTQDIELADAPLAADTVADTAVGRSQANPDKSPSQSSAQAIEVPSADPAAAETSTRDIDLADAPVTQTSANPTPVTTQNGTSEAPAVNAASTAIPIEQAPAQRPDDTTTDSMVVDQPGSPPSLTSALEAALGGLDGDNAEEVLGQLQARPAEANGPEQPAQGPEWEADSSPYESSSDSSSSSDSDSDDDSDNEGYELLGVEETARLLMEAEGGSDDEGGERSGKASGSTQLRTKNEMPEEIIPKPDVTITPEMKVDELGVIEHIVENIILVKAHTTGEYQVLDTGSVLCTEERVVLGAVAETIGKVLQPMYTVYFSSSEEIEELKLKVGTKVFYPADHASFVFTEPLKGLKGSDASNLHDEEVGDDEMEFSDDEKELEYKRAIKNKKKAKQNRGGREPHPLRQEMGAADPGELNYDDDDGPYKPLTRPPGFGSGPVSQESEPSRHNPHRGRGRGDFRGRGQRGRGRDHRGGSNAGRGRPPSDGYSLPPQNTMQAPQLQAFQPPPPPGWNAQGGPPAPMPNFPFQWPPQPQANASSGQAWQPPPPPGWPGSTAQAPAGGVMDPAVIASLMGQIYNQNAQQQQQPPHWGGQQGH